MQAAFDNLQNAGKQTLDAIDGWYAAVDPGFEILDHHNAMVVTRQTLFEIASSLEPWGIKEY